MSPPDALDRRDFLKLGTAAVAATSSALGGVPRELPAPATPFAAPPIDVVRIGFVGVGLQGGGHVENFLRIPGCRITAVCDIREERTDLGDQADHGGGHPAPAVVHPRPPRLRAPVRDGGPRSGLHRDAVGVARAGVLAAMKNGKHAATEVPAAITIDDCWELVETAETSAEALRDDGELQLRPRRR